jgi:phosphatidylserine/phosphatidylglycerophosphate/cardiolipin synthase-like enzyme
MGPSHLAYVVQAIATEREAVQRSTDRVELVWTGPEQTASTSRDTGVVVRELFSAARESVYVAGFAVYNGRTVVKTLADNMERNPDLAVHMFLNVARKHLDARPPEELLHEYMVDFVRNEWPGGRLPTMYHDPRALLIDPGPRASLHAKCIVADGRWAFITSANFTEAAQHRNIEAGVLIDDMTFASSLRNHLDGLINAGLVRPMSQPLQSSND